MVVFKVHILGTLARPAERDTVVSANPDGPSLRVAVKEMKPVTGDVHIRGLNGHFQRLKDAYALSDVFGANPPRTPGKAAEMLDVSRYEIDGILKCAGVYLGYTVEELERDRETHQIIQGGSTNLDQFG